MDIVHPSLYVGTKSIEIRTRESGLLLEDDMGPRRSSYYCLGIRHERILVEMVRQGLAEVGMFELNIAYWSL